MIALATSVVCTVVLLSQTGWSASGGRESFTYRDIARGGPPADASPVEWTGSGPSIVLVHERATARRAHRLTIDVAKAGSFRYDGPVLATPGAAADRATRLEARYEYRRYLLRDRFLRGLDTAIGLQGGGRRLWLQRHTGAATQEQSSTAASVAGVVSARFHRWTRWSAEIDWRNGIAALRQHDTYSVDALSDVRQWGGGWLTDLAVAGTVHVSRRTAVSASFLSTGEGTALSHHSFAFARRRLTLGVTYVR